MILNTYSVPFTAMDCQSIRLCYAVVGGAVNIKTKNPYIYIYMDKIKDQVRGLRFIDQERIRDFKDGLPVIELVVQRKKDTFSLLNRMMT